MNISIEHLRNANRAFTEVCAERNRYRQALVEIALNPERAAQIVERALQNNKRTDHA